MQKRQEQQKQQQHVPVLLKEAIQGLKISNGKKYIDATIGSGGHAREIVRRGGIVLGVDRDPVILERLKKRWEVRSEKSDKKVGKWKIETGNFADLRKIAKRHGFNKVSGILFDLGFSTWQLEESGRGFSFKKLNEPLDMRFNPKKQKIRALDILNKERKEVLNEIFARYAEEEHYQTVVNIIFRSRPIKKVEDLVNILEGKYKLSRIFQALRIAVNDELDNIKKGLDIAVSLLGKEGRLAVISFHSLEDRIVKLKMNSEHSRKRLKILTKKPIRASKKEAITNPKALSAKLRIAEKL